MSLIDEFKRLTDDELQEIDHLFIGMRARKKAQLIRTEIPAQKQPAFGSYANTHDNTGRLLTDEEIWDRDHPLSRRPYGYYERKQLFGNAQQTKVWSKAEVDAYNKPIEEAWLAEKRKLFPNAQLPKNKDLGHRHSRMGNGATRRG